MVNDENTDTDEHKPLKASFEFGEISEVDEADLLPQSTNWNGKTVGCYIRNSTSAQVGNDRAAFQADMVPYLQTLGYAVRVYDEQGRSAGTLYRRKKAVGMLADLEAGRIDGVAVVEVSRLTRDEYGFDAPRIGEKIRRFAHGLLITYGQIWDLRREADWQLYQIQTMASGWQKLSIRKYLFQGLKRAAEDRPMFRKRNRIGYKREVVRDGRGEPVIRRNGRVYTVFVKDLTWADSMEALRRELTQQGTMPDVAAALNAAGVPAPWLPRGVGDRVWQWRGAYIRSIISDPLYYGEPAFMTSQPGPVWDQFIAVDPEFDPRRVCWKLPELAWWTKNEALAWRHKFLDDYVKSRHRKHHHLLLGLLVCQTCGRKMVKQGLDRTGDRYYRCPGYGIKGDDVRHCPKGQFIMEKNALRLLRDYALPVLFADVRALAEAAERNATTHAMSRRNAGNSNRLTSENGICWRPWQTAATRLSSRRC